MCTLLQKQKMNLGGYFFPRVGHSHGSLGPLAAKFGPFVFEAERCSDFFVLTAFLDMSSSRVYVFWQPRSSIWNIGPLHQVHRPYCRSFRPDHATQSDIAEVNFLRGKLMSKFFWKQFYWWSCNYCGTKEGDSYPWAHQYSKLDRPENCDQCAVSHKLQKLERMVTCGE